MSADRERSQWVEALFAAACRLDGDSRSSFLQRACEDDDIRAEIEALLAHDANPHEALRAPRAGAALSPNAETSTDQGHGGASTPNRILEQPRQVGPYRILEALGEGGMGTVYLAEQTEPFRRRVALKIIKLGMDTRSVIARFESERQALAMMNHPHVARVLDAGSTDTGRPYFVMEYVKGEPITAYCDRHRLSTDDRLELFIHVCHAVQHAHQKGIIHRDIKPSNVLVAIESDSPVPKVIDFGVAKATEHRLTKHTLFTEQGQLVGTPEYMSPEQAEMSRLDIDTRTDVYSLGVLLYELLVGALPFDSSTLRGAAFGEIQRIIREQEPPKPSTRVQPAAASTAGIASHRRTDSSSLARRIRGDLDWITLKAMEKDRTRRYATPLDLAADIRRHLRHEPVDACPPSSGYVARKFLRKNRGPVLAVSAVILALLAGLVLARVQFRRAEALAEQERAAKEELLRLADIRRVSGARSAADALWPAHPHNIPAMQAWLSKQARPLRERLDTHRAALAALRETATDYDATARTWTFASDEQHWQHDTLSELVADLKRFADEDPQVGTLASVEQRLAFAEAVESRTTTGPAAAAAWSAAIEDIARAPQYGGLHIRPQLGLLPLRRDPRSGLWEFWHVYSGARPEPNPDEQALDPWIITPDSGLIFVLLPGGTFTMGAQSDDSRSEDYDAAAQPDEAPPHQVTLAPFFVSRYEMTQGQWRRFTGSNPSRYSPGFRSSQEFSPTPTHPVEQISWHDCTRELERLGLALPTESQWEYAARAGTTTPWWTGAERQTIASAHAANLADSSAKGRGGPPGWSYEMWLEDGWLVHAAVGSFAPNAFGLHDTIGNVGEWCRDWYAEPYTPAVGSVDGFRDHEGSQKMARGGSFLNSADIGRSAFRGRYPPMSLNQHIGVRPVRPLVP